MRMLHEKESWPDACFITLTYAPENLPSRGLKKKDLQNFFKRLRKRVTPLRYFACGEYGEQYTERAHYHAIVYGMNKAKAQKILPEVWTLGSTDSGHCEEDSIRYVAGYIDKKWMEGDQKHTEYMGKTPPFQLQSQKIGAKYLWENQDTIIANGLTFRGNPQGIPRYYLEKLKLWRPGTVDSYWLKRDQERIARESDDVLELMPETAGVPYSELTEDQVHYVRAVHKKKGQIMQANLKAKASIHALRSKEKGKKIR